MIVRGKEISANIIERLNVDGTLKGKKLTVLSAGDNKSAMSYLKGITNVANKLDVVVDHVNLLESTSNEEFAHTIETYNNSDTDGILILSPLPKHLDLSLLGNKISANKDVDCLNESNTGKFYLSSSPNEVGPCTAKAVMEFIYQNNLDLKGKKVCIIGASNIVGKPLSKLFLQAGATVTVCNSHTIDLHFHVSNADVVVPCAGVPSLVKKDMLKYDTIVIDVGINFVDGKLCGDVDYDECLQKTANLTPVPGGVGSVTSSMLFDNLSLLIVRR